MNYTNKLIPFLLIFQIMLPCCRQKGETNKYPSGQYTDVQNSTAPSMSIYQAALEGNINAVSSILDNGFNPDTPDTDGRTALMYAAFNGHHEIIRKLIQRRASVNLPDINGRTALMMAASGPYRDAVKVLLDNNADPDIADREEHYSALMYAASEGQIEVVQILLTYNADPLLKDTDGDDALTFAINNNHMDVAALIRTAMKNYTKK